MKKVTNARLPFKEVKIGHSEFPINFVGNTFDFGASNCLGQCDFTTYEISLYDQLSDKRLRQVLVHEIVHGMSDVYAISMPPELSEMEQHVDALASAFLAFIRDNPEVVRWLTKK